MAGQPLTSVESTPGLGKLKTTEIMVGHETESEVKFALTISVSQEIESEAVFSAIDPVPKFDLWVFVSLYLG